MTDKNGRKLLGLLQVIQRQQFLPIGILVNDVRFCLLFVSVGIACRVILVGCIVLSNNLTCRRHCLLLLPRNILRLLPFTWSHLGIIRLLVLLQFSREIQEVEVDFDHLLGRAAVVRQSPELVLEFEQFAVGAEGDLADAVHVEVELILVEILVVFDYCHVLSQTPSQVPLPPPTICQFQLVPRTLHIIQIVLRIALFTGEQ
mmetsp:Transcript_16293/g.29558  ORF Transcript_16293/g.29558 Transcript_16293/m.29558 type:complete len:202 (+) Transcript_16293:614-1219(+)